MTMGHAIAIGVSGLVAVLCVVVLVRRKTGLEVDREDMKRWIAANRGKK